MNQTVQPGSRTGTVSIPASKSPDFKAGKAFKDAVDR